MNEEIMARTNFSDIDVEQTAYLTYKPYKEVPGSEEFVYGEERTIVLRNTATGMLEKIDYVLCGGIPWMTHAGYQEFWGEIKSVDSIPCYLTFTFKSSGELEKITASFAGKSPSDSEFAKMNKLVSCAAQITAIGDFGTIPFRENEKGE